MVLFTHKQKIFAAKHSWTTFRMRRPFIYLLAVICRSRGGLQANEKEDKFASNDESVCQRVNNAFPWTLSVIQTLESFVSAM